MNFTTKFEIDDIVRYQDQEFRVYEIRIIMDDISPQGEIEYTLLEPADSDRDDYYKLSELEIENATLVRPAVEELARLGWDA